MPTKRNLLRGSGRGDFLRADCIENAGSGLLDMFQALCQELGVSFVKLNLILRRRASLKADPAATTNEIARASDPRTDLNPVSSLSNQVDGFSDKIWPDEL